MSLSSSILALALAVPGLAAAGCSRPIVVPVSPLGFSVTVDKSGQIGGVFPALMLDIGSKIGCEIRMTEVPRARLEMMFEQGHADMLLAATHAERRDKFGQFVALIQTRATLVSLDPKHPPIHTMAELLARPDLKLALVRGFDYGPAYNKLSERLQAEGRLILARDPLEIARMLKAGIANFTILPASGIWGAAKADPRTADIADAFRVEPLEELPWIPAGVYLSLQSLSESDRAVLEAGLNAAAKSGALYHAYKNLYPATLFVLGSRPL